MCVFYLLLHLCVGTHKLNSNMTILGVNLALGFGFINDSYLVDAKHVC
jgi:hypothetical protein